VHAAGLDQLGDLVSVAHSKESPAAPKFAPPST
jgi:hypothetical protein